MLNGSGVPEASSDASGARNRPDSLSGVIDNLTKMTEELGILEENNFTSGENI